MVTFVFFVTRPLSHVRDDDRNRYGDLAGSVAVGMRLVPGEGEDFTGMYFVVLPCDQNLQASFKDMQILSRAQKVGLAAHAGPRSKLHAIDFDAAYSVRKQFEDTQLPA